MALGPQAVTISQVNPLSRGGVSAGGVVIIGVAGRYTVFERVNEPEQQCVQYVRIQNVGLGVVFVSIVDDATALVYNYCLAVDTGAAAGNGGVCEIPGSWAINKITAFSTAGSTIAIVKVLTKIIGRVIN